MSAAQQFSGERLKQLRLRKGFTQAQLARRGEMREQQIIRWENERNVPSANAVAQLAAALGTGVDAFYENSSTAGDDEEPDPVARFGSLVTELVTAAVKVREVAETPGPWDGRDRRTGDRRSRRVRTLAMARMGALEDQARESGRGRL